jgi:hypothetical protein
VGKWRVARTRALQARRIPGCFISSATSDATEAGDCFQQNKNKTARPTPNKIKRIKVSASTSGGRSIHKLKQPGASGLNRLCGKRFNRNIVRKRETAALTKVDGEAIFNSQLIIAVGLRIPKIA